MHGTKEKSDGYIRLDVPGGWAGDKVNQFEASGRSAVQNEAWNFLQTLLKWRRGNEVIAKGKMKHFMPNQGVYVYERSLNGKRVVIFMNGSSNAVELPLDRYAETLQGSNQGKDVLTGRTVSFGTSLSMKAKEILVVEL